MPKRIVYFSIMFLLFFSNVVFSADRYSLDFSKGARKVVPRTNEVTQLSEVPGQKVKGYEFTWNSDKNKYIEMAFNKPVKLPAFHSAVVRAKIWAPVGCPVHTLNVRIHDKDVEVFQYRKNVSFAQGGFFDVEWYVTPYNAEGSWGSNTVNKKVDMPATLSTMIVGYISEIPSGKIWLLDLSVEPFFGSENVEASRPICPANSASAIRRIWGNGNLSVEKNAIHLSDVTSRFGVFERKFEIHRYEKAPVRLVFDTELLEGETSLSACYVYADKAVRDDNTQSFELKPIPIKSGRNLTVLETGDSLKEAVHAVRLHRFELIPRGKKPVKLIIHNVYVITKELAAEAVDFDIVTDRAVHVLTVGSEDKLRFRFVNRAEKDGNFLINLEYENYFGEKHNERFDVAIQSGKSIELNPKWRPDSYGHWNVKATIQTKTKSSSRAVKSRSFAWIKPAGPTRGRSTGFLFSVCTHTERWSELDQQLEIEAAALCGIKVARVGGFGWAALEPERGVWKWNIADELVKNYGKNGIEAQVILCSPPSWAVSEAIRNDKSKKTWKNSPADLNDWRTYIQKIGTHFKGRIRFYEIWNEPDLTGFSEMSLEQYVSLQKAAYEEMAKTDPSALVLTGGFATLSRHPGLIYQDFQRDYLLAAKGYFKIHAIHEHGWFDGYKKRIDELFLPLRKATGVTTPWYSNETAMTSIGGYEKRQAQTLFKKLLFAWIRGSIGYTWYDLRNDGFDPVYGEHHFGLITNDFYPKEVYSVYNMLASYYSKMEAVADYSPDEKVNLYAFSDGKNILLPGWSESNLSECRQIVIKTDAKSAKLIDLMGNEKPVEIRDSIIVYELGSDPQTLKLENCTNGKPIGELLAVKKNKEAVPGRKWSLALNVFNPLNMELEFDLSFNYLSSHFKTESHTQKIHVPSSGQKEASFVFDVSRDLTKTTMLPLHYTISGTNWQGIRFIPIVPAIWIGRESNTDNPEFVLDKYDQITPTTPADPANSHRLWSGTKDLSAKVRLSNNGDRLVIKYEVEDDKNVCGDGSDFERGDQVRMLYQSEGNNDFSEIALCKDRSGKSLVRLIQTKNNVTQKAIDQFGKLEIRREMSTTIYEFSIPFETLGLSRERLFEQGGRFDFVIGDDDGEGIDSWLHYTPEKLTSENMKNAPLLLFEK